MTNQMTREECLSKLSLKAAEMDRLPQKADFTEVEVARIKSLFGPWPRALEAAGLKPSKETERIEKNREKRVRAKRRLTETLKNPNQ